MHIAIPLADFLAIDECHLPVTAINIGTGRRHIVNDIDNKRSRRVVAILIGDHNGKVIKGRVARSVGRQRHTHSQSHPAAMLVMVNVPIAAHVKVWPHCSNRYVPSMVTVAGPSGAV